MYDEGLQDASDKELLNALKDLMRDDLPDEDKKKIIYNIG